MGVVQTKEVRSTTAASKGVGVVVSLVNEMGVVQTKEVRSTTAASTTPLVSAAAPAPAALTAAVLVDVELADSTNRGGEVAVDASGDDAIAEGVLGSEDGGWVGEDGGDRGGSEVVPGSRGAEGVGEDAGDSGGPEGVPRSRSSEGTAEEEGNRCESWEDGGREAEVEAVTVEKMGRKEKIRPLYPRRPGQPDCTFFVESGYCKFKADCKFNHPPNRRKSRTGQYIKQPDTFQVAEKQKNVAQQSAIQPEHEKDADMNSNLKEGEKRIKYPQRPDATDCTFYTKTGTCKFGSACRFNHPPCRKKNKEKVEKHSEHIQKDSEMSGNLKEGDKRIKYPQRPDATDCTFYKTGTCKFGSACRFNHPHDKKKNKEKVGSQSEHIQVGAKKQQTSKQSTLKQYMDVKEKSKKPSTKSFGQMEKHYTNPRASKFETSKNSNHHGVKKAPSVALNFLNLPIRPGAKECPQYMSEGCCKFGVNCMHHHPDPTATIEPVPLSQYQDGQCAQQFSYGVSPTPGTPWHVSTSYTTGMHLPFGFYPNTE